MEVGKSGNSDAGNVVGAGAGRAFGDREDSAIGDADPNVARPAGWQKSVIEKELVSQVAFSAPGGICLGPILLDNRRPCANKYGNLTDLLDPVMTHAVRRDLARCAPCNPSARPAGARDR